MQEDDNRFKPMCCHFLSDAPCDDRLIGAQECQSPFGSYNISMPIDKDAECGSSRLKDKNCKDFDVSKHSI